MNLTPALVRGYCNHMSKVYKTTYVRKQSDPNMRAVALALDMMKIADEKAFLESFATTVVIGKERLIYLPFKPGSDAIPLYQQIETVTHEHHHVRQVIVAGPGHQVKYLLDTDYRGHAEARALRCNMELHFFLTGRVLNPHIMAYSLDAYGLNKKQIRVAERHLQETARVVAAGGVSNHASKTGIRWLKAA